MSAERRLPHEPPTIGSERLTLRLLNERDADEIQTLASAPEIADTTLRIPHPYPENGAREFIGVAARAYEEDAGAHFAIRRREDDRLVGCIGLTMDDGPSAEVGCWVGVPFWGAGDATDALPALMNFAFAPTPLERVHAFHFARNGASGSVLEKAGFRWLRHETHCCMKQGRPEPTEHLELRRGDFAGRRP